MNEQHNLQLSIYIEPKYHCGEPINLKFEIKNMSDYDYALLVFNTPLEREVFNFLEVQHENRLIPYDGRFVKRGNPTPNSYRRIEAGQTIVEELDLSMSFAFDNPGTYTITLYTRFLDAIPKVGRDIEARSRHAYQSLTFDPISTNFELLPDGKPRITVGEQARQRQNERRQPYTSNEISKDILEAHKNALAWVNAALEELSSWSSETENRLYTEWFGIYDKSRYHTVQDNYSKIKSAMLGEHYYNDENSSLCSVGILAYTYWGSDTVWICKDFHSILATGMVSKFGTLVHEWSHAAARTEDITIREDEARELAKKDPEAAIRNGDNYAYFDEMLGDHMLAAPVVWPSDKAYLFVAGKYYRYDIEADRVDPEYPLPIAGNWPGLWEDRIDAAVAWPNGKIYFFRDSQYMRYDIEADRVDPGYPLPIAGKWPGLWEDHIDAAVVWPNGKAYFFKGQQYMRYDIEADRVDPGYPLPIAGNWPGLWGNLINGVVAWPNGKAYFLRGWQYIRYDIEADRSDPGYPLSIEGNWPGLPGPVS